MLKKTLTSNIYNGFKVAGHAYARDWVWVSEVKFIEAMLKVAKSIDEKYYIADIRRV